MEFSHGCFGATFLHEHSSTDSTVTSFFAARPGLRLWKADICGTVQSTLIFSKPTFHVAADSKRSAGSNSPSCSRSSDDVQFGLLRPFAGGLLFSYTDSVLLLANIEQNGRIIFARREPLEDLAVNGDEIFVLRKCGGDSRTVPLIRLGRQSLGARRWRNLRPSSASVSEYCIIVDIRC